MLESEIFDAIDRFRRDVLQMERSAASELVRVYGEAWKRIREELDRLHTEYEETKARGEKPGVDWIYQYNRARALRDQVLRELLTFAQDAESKVREQQIEAIRVAEEQAERLVRLALGTPPAGIVVNWNRIDHAVVQTMLGMVQVDSPLHKLFVSISSEGAQAAEDALVQNALLGKSPREAAREVRKALGTTLSRALRIARTETLRAHREATRASYQANSDLVEGWIWHSALGERTCAACWAMHGTFHTLDERLDDHPNGRCAMVPATKSWAEIGRQFGLDFGDVDETAPKIALGVDLFERLPVETQTKILGPAKYAAWEDGRFALGDIVGRKRSREWGTHRYEKSLEEVLGREKAKIYIKSISGGRRNRTEIEKYEHASKYYESIRKRKSNTDVASIAKQTGWKQDSIQKIKEHIFINVHDFGDGDFGRFEPDFDIALAWQRLQAGKYRQSDLVLLKHEYLELVYMRRYNANYREAHAYATKKHNWADLVGK